MYKVNEIPNNLVIGNQGEKNTRVFEFDVSAWLAEYPDAEYGISVTTPDVVTPFMSPGVTLDRETGIMTWKITPHLTQTAGQGTAVLRCVAPGETAEETDDLRNVMIFTRVAPGHGATGPVPPWFTGGGGDVEEAPIDGKQYGRQDGEWTEILAAVIEQGGEGITFDTFADFASGAITLDPDTIVKTRGYFEPHDEGGATYKIIDTQAHDWDLLLAPGKWASILNRDFVSYRMFGAPLNGTDDDGPAMRKAHAYADSIFIIDGNGKLPIYLCRIENHCGTIYKKDTDAITFNSDINLSGSILKVDEVNAAWFGIYVWGNNDSLRWTYEPSDAMKASFTKDNHVIVNEDSHGSQLPGNAVIMFEEDPYTARDDAGYSYTVARKELIVHDLDGMCSSPFTDDWVNAGGQEVSVLVSDLINGGYKTETMYTTFKTSYNFAHPKHGLFVGCEVQMNVPANKYHCAVWVKRHNCEIRDFTFIPLAENLHNTVYKNTMIYLWNAYGVRVKNIQGFNAAGKKVGASKATSGYILRLTNCSDVYVSDCRLQGYWGATAMDSVKNIRFSRCHINRLDIHDYFANLWADECVFYNSAIQIGYGRGIASFTNSRFHLNPAPGDSYPGSYICSLNMSYGRIFEGTLYVDNCQVYSKNLPDNEFNMFKAEFSPTATTITPHFKFPEVIVQNTQVYSATPGTHYSYFKITGTRRGTTSGVRPSHVKDVSGDNTVRWRYSGRGLDWDMADNDAVTVGQIVRVTDRFLDNETPPKTQFYNKRYYRCTVAGNVSLAGPKPTDTSGTPFTNGTATLVYIGPDILWKAKHAYNVGDICAVSHSEWLPLFVFVCEQAGTSNGFFPTHSSGTVIDGINDPINEPDAVWWTYVAEKAAWLVNWSADMNVTVGQRLLIENRIYEVMQAGQLTDLPPYETGWMQTYDWGTAKLKFIGLQWGARQWYPLGAYCEARGRIYQVANHDGTTSGVLPVRGNESCVDGDIVWKHVSGSNTLPGQTSGDTWTSGMAPTHGQTVIANGNTYECIFDGKMVLPNKTVFKNIVTNMSNGQVFWFYTGTNIPAKTGDKPWTIIAEDCEGIAQLVKFPSGMTKYFGNANNPVPTGILTTTGSGGGLLDAPSDGKQYARQGGQWSEIVMPEVPDSTNFSPYVDDLGMWVDDYLGYLNKFTASSGPIAINTLGLVGAKFIPDNPQTAFAPPSTSSSEAQILVARGVLKNYIATKDEKWRTLAEILTNALLSYYYPSATIPNAPDEKWVPHWLVNVNAPFTSREYHLNGEVTFVNGVGVAAFPMINRVYSVRATNAELEYTWSPDAPVVGVEYPIESTEVQYGAGSATITLLNKSFNGTALIVYSAETGPTIAVGDKCEATPVWRPLDEGEIACAVDTLPWAFDLFQLWYSVTKDPKWIKAMDSTKKAIRKAADVSNVTNYIAPGNDGDPVMTGGLTYYSQRDPVETYTNSEGLILINYPAAAGESSISRWVGNHIAFSESAWIKARIGASSQASIRLMLDEDDVFSPTKRWMCTLLLDGDWIEKADLQEFNLYPRDFYKSEGVLWGAAYGKTSSGDPIKSANSSVTKTNLITMVNGIKKEISRFDFVRGDEGGWTGWAQFMLSLFGHRLPMTISYKTSDEVEIIITDANGVKWHCALPAASDDFEEVTLTAGMFTPESSASPDILGSADYQSILIASISNTASIDVEYIGTLVRMSSMIPTYYSSIGLMYSGSAALDMAIEYIRPAPERTPIPYAPYLLPFDYHIVDNSVSDLRGAVYTGYQAPWIFQEGVFEDSALAVDTNLSFLQAAQDAYELSTGHRGFFVPIYWWDYREDYEDNAPNSFGWHSRWDDWGGFQYRTVSDVARVLVKDPSNVKATQIVLDFARAVDRVWADDYTDFPARFDEGENPSAGNADPQMVANFMRALTYSMYASTLSTNDRNFIRGLIVRCLDYLNHFRVPVLSDYTGPQVEGTFSPSPETDEWYQFWGGDILDALGVVNINKNVISAIEVGGSGGISDAASDGKMYARKDGAWAEVPAPDEAANGLPTGGTTGQILKKSSGTDYAVEWGDAPSGGGGSNDSTVGSVRLLKDVGRLYTPGNSGILRISLGTAPSGDTFIAGTVYGYRHDTRQRWQVDFAGYTGGSWGSLKVVLSPNCPFTDVRRAMWNGAPCILLGLTSTAWGFQMCYIPEVLVAYSGMASVAATWPMAIVNTETGITSIVAAEEKKTLTST